MKTSRPFFAVRKLPLRQQISGRLREVIARRWGIPYSRHGTPPLLLRVLRAGKPIRLIDVGASDGQFALSLALEYGLAQALLVEPQPARAEQLRQMFSGTDVIVAQTALSNEPGELPMDILRWDYSSSLLPVDRTYSAVAERIDLSVRETITVPVTTLDALCATTDFESTDLLKLDVQGAELLVLQGSKKVLGNTRFILSEVSFHPYYIGGAQFEQVRSYLKECGFKLLGLTEGFHDAKDELVEGDALFGR